MKISQINIKMEKELFLTSFMHSRYWNEPKNIEEELEKQKILLNDFLKNNKKKFYIIESGKMEMVNCDGKKQAGSNFYSGYYVKYYTGNMVIDGSNIAMNVNLNKEIINFILKATGGEIKELVKQEYQEFEKQLNDLIDKTEKKNIFGNFVVTKLKELKNAILNNSNK